MSDYKQRVWDRVAGLTGRDADELDGAMFLQADLGFDSLKTMALWQAIFGLLPPGISGDLQDFAAVQTLDDLVGALELLAGRKAVADDRAACVSDTDPGGTRLPMAHAQQFFLLSHQLVQSTSLCSMVELSGRVDPLRLRLAWDRLIARHINLRTCFYVPPGATQLTQTEYRLLPDRCAPEVRVVELADAGALEATFHGQLNRRWDLRQWPLHDVICLRLADGHDAVMIANEHIISDGLGNQRLLADLLALYENPQAVLLPVLDGAAYIAAIEAMNAHSDPEDEADQARAEAAQKGLRSLWDPQGKVELDNGPVTFRNRRMVFGKAKTAALQARAAAAGTSLYALLLASLNAAFRDRIGAATGQPALVQVPTGGRVWPGIDLQETVGCFAQNLSLCLDGRAPDLPASATRIAEGLRDAMLSGHDRVQSRAMALAMQADFPMEQGLVPRFVLSQARKSLRSNLYAPYTGETGLPVQLAGMAVSGYRAATKNVAGTIDILHELHDGALIAFVNHDAAAFADADITALMEDHRAALLALIALQAEPAADDTLFALIDAASAILQRPLTRADAGADLQSGLGMDSLGKIRLVTAASPASGGRALARQMISCRTLAEMAALVAAAQASPAPAQPAPVPAWHAMATPLRPDLPPVPFRHFEAQARETPEAEAVTDGTTSLTYAELDREANRLANTLATAGVGQGDRVAVTCSRGPDMLVALLGILKLGAAYVPLDPDFPADRMAYIFDHAGCAMWVADPGLLAPHLKGTDLPKGLRLVVCLGDPSPDLPARLQVGRADWASRSGAPQVEIDSDGLMVLLYTSGSTGQPKGVACHHRGYMNRIDWHQKAFALAPGERVALKTSFSFDVSVWEIFWPLMVGGTVCAASRETVTNPWALADWLATNRIAVMHFVPSLFNAFVNAVGHEDLGLTDLRWLILSGEALGVKPVRSWMLRQGGRTRLANLYGPTEASIDVTCEYIDTVPPEDATRISIGRAIDLTVMLILDDANCPIRAPGVPGELCIAGVQVASGYYRDPERTAAAFIPNHLADEGVPGKVIYRTGDLASWHDDGRIDYLGRKDSQVKLRGFRIELGEIEAVAANHPDVTEAAAVLVRATDDAAQDRLVLAYAPASTDAGALSDWLARHLAAYAVPDLLLPLDVLPKNPNGKLDRKALPTDSAAPVPPPQAKVRALPLRVSERPAAPPQAASLREQGAALCGASLLMMDYEAALDIAGFTRAINAVIAEHPALGATFHRQGSRWMRREETALPSFQPQLFDATHLDEATFRPAFAAAARQAALDLHPGRWPLIGVLVARRAADRLTIAIVGSTLVGDMVGSFTFGRAIWRHYLAGSPDAPVTQVADTNDHGLRIARSGAMAGAAGWWATHLGAVPDGTALPADFPLGENLQGAAASTSVALSRAETVALTDALSALGGIALQDAVGAAFYLQADRATGTGHVTIAHRLNGRAILPEKLYFDAVDSFAHNVPLRLDLTKHEPLPAVARRLAALQAEMPLKGWSYDACGPDLPARLWPAGAVTDLRLNFLGEARSPQNSAVRFRPEDSHGRIAPEHAPRNCGVELAVQLSDGCLTLTAHYAATRHAPETLTRLLDAIAADLRALSREKDLTNAA